MTKLLHGCSLEQLKSLNDNSIDAVVTDPPYGLNFMGKKWDYDVPSKELWTEVLRVLKPGGHLLSFGGTRTYHRLAVNIEDAGFEIRDQIMWIYGSGFPKSHDVSKAIDKAAGAEREVIGLAVNSYPDSGRKDMHRKGGGKVFNQGDGLNQNVITAPSTEAAKKYQGWGSALKPANEPIVVARKPLEKGLTLAANVLKYGTGALNIDASRIGFSENEPDSRVGTDKTKKGNVFGANGVYGKAENKTEPLVFKSNGRWPANILFDEEAASVLDGQSGSLSKQGSKKLKDCPSKTFSGGSKDSTFYGDTGGASRFFYVAKASKRERGEGNSHPTVKPVKLMEYLIRLVTPVGGVVLDPFMGSGTTGVAAVGLGFSFVGVEREKAYLEISTNRINHKLKGEAHEQNQLAL